MIDANQNMPDWLNVSRETESRLLAYCEIVKKWTPAVNLIAKSTIPDLWRRHILDSAQLFLFLPPHANHWLDLGSGAGFPGLVIAILAKEYRPALVITLVESDRRKAVFLAEAARAVGVSVTIENARAEVLASKAADVISARALTSLDRLCFYAKTHLKAGGVAIFPKGLNAAIEIDAALLKWQFSLEIQASKTDPSASVLLLRDIQDA